MRAEFSNDPNKMGPLNINETNLRSSSHRLLYKTNRSPLLQNPGSHAGVEGYQYNTGGGPTKHKNEEYVQNRGSPSKGPVEIYQNKFNVQTDLLASSRNMLDQKMNNLYDKKNPVSPHREMDSPNTKYYGSLLDLAKNPDKLDANRLSQQRTNLLAEITRKHDPYGDQKNFDRLDNIETKNP